MFMVDVLLQTAQVLHEHILWLLSMCACRHPLPYSCTGHMTCSKSCSTEYVTCKATHSCCLLLLQLTVQSWRLAWNFTDGEVLAEAADYFPNTSYPLPGSFNTSHVEIQSTSLTADDEQQAVQNAWFYPSQVGAPRTVCLLACA